MAAGSGTVSFQIFDVDVRDVFGDDEATRGQCKVLVYGRTLRGEGVLLCVNGFRPWFFVGVKSLGGSLPPNVNPDALGRDLVMGAYDLRHPHESRRSYGPERKVYSPKYHPTSHYERRRHMFGWEGDPATGGSTTLVYPWWRMRFAGGSKRYHGAKTFRGYVFHGHPCQVWGDDAPDDTQFLIQTGTRRNGWVEVDLSKVSALVSRVHTYCCDLEITCDISVVRALPDCNDNAPRRLLSWDGEMFSVNGDFPLPEVPGNVIMNVGASTSTMYAPDAEETRRDYVFCLGSLPPRAQEDPEHRGKFFPYEREPELICAWRTWAVEKYDVDVLIAYNCRIFDWPYFVGRAKHHSILPFFSRWSKLRCDSCQFLQDDKSENKQKGAREICRWKRTFGIFDFDMFQFFLSTEKLRSYKLDFVANKFLQDSKIPLSPQQMMSNFATEEGRFETALYCSKDCDLPLRLFVQRMVLPQYTEMSRLTFTSLEDLQSRGQQRKILNMLVYYSEREGYVMNVVTGLDLVSPEGAIVIPPKAGFYQTPVLTLDFEALYPSIIRAWNLCWTTAVLHDQQRLHPRAEYVAHPIPGRNVEHTFVTHVRGLTPQILEELHAARKQAKREMAAEKDPARKSVLNGRQLALKLSANSIYGFTLALAGNQYALTHIGETVTAQGRRMIMQTKAFVENTFTAAHFYGSDELTPEAIRGKRAEVVYGDSVPGDTPLVVRRSGTTTAVVTIRSLFVGGEDRPSPGREDWPSPGREDWPSPGREDRPSPGREDRPSPGREDGAKEYSDPAGLLEVWSDSGFTRVVRVMRHFTDKPLFRVTTRSAGYVVVTHDHSLLDTHRRPIRPAEVVVGVTRLLACPSPPTPSSGRRPHWPGWEPGSAIDSTVTDIEQLPSAPDCVYDLHTENHHFAAGLGCIVVHNTDSVMVLAPVESSRTGLRLAIEGGPSMGEKVNELFRKPINLEYEKVFYPFYLTEKKKKYVGKKYETSPDSFVVDSKGLENIRRETFLFTSNLLNRVIDDVIVQEDPSRARATVDAELARFLVPGEVPFEQFVLSKSIKHIDNYAGKQAHVEVAKRMRERNPGSEPRAGDRVAYVIVRRPGTTAVSEKAEDPEYAMRHNLQLDLVHYINNCVKKPITRFCVLFYPDIEVTFRRLIAKLEDRSSGQLSFDTLGALGPPTPVVQEPPPEATAPPAKRLKPTTAPLTRQLTFAHLGK